MGDEKGEEMEIEHLVEQAKRQLSDLTGLKPVAVTSISREDGSWHLRLELLEMARIPPAADLLGEYDVSLDQEGRLQRFERRRSRLRGEPVAAEERV